MIDAAEYKQELENQMSVGEFNAVDGKALAEFLKSPVGRKVMLLVNLRAKELGESVALMNLTSEEGVKKAINKQGCTTGVVLAIEYIVDLATVGNPTEGETDASK